MTQQTAEKPRGISPEEILEDTRHELDAFFLMDVRATPERIKTIKTLLLRRLEAQAKHLATRVNALPDDGGEETIDDLHEIFLKTNPSLSD